MSSSDTSFPRKIFFPFLFFLCRSFLHDIIAIVLIVVSYAYNGWQDVLKPCIQYSFCYVFGRSGWDVWYCLDVSSRSSDELLCGNWQICSSLNPGFSYQYFIVVRISLYLKKMKQFLFRHAFGSLWKSFVIKVCVVDTITSWAYTLLAATTFYFLSVKSIH